MIKQTQSQRQEQKLLPKIIQKQTMLQVPTFALEEVIMAELEQNPFLELEEEQEQESPELELEVSETPVDDEGKPIEEEMKETTEVREDDLDYDYYDTADTEGYKTEEYKEKEKREVIENVWRAPLTLSDMLKTQLHLEDLSELEILIGEKLIEYIDNNGFLSEPLDVILQEIISDVQQIDLKTEEINIELLERVLKIIQSFDPPGVGARNIQEALIIQTELAEDLEENLKSLYLKVLKEYYNELTNKKFKNLKDELKITESEIETIYEWITKLNPKPGASIDSSNDIYIYPDLIVTENNEGNLIIELNDRHIPSVRMNRMYQLLAEKPHSKDKTFYKNYYDRAKWFLDALQSRRETMLKVMNSIVKHQKEFFKTKGQHLRPMYEKDVAEDIGMDISTVSRTVRGKYVQTDFGIYELRSFFSSHLKKEDGEDVSVKEIKNKINDLITNENPLSPLSDEELSKLLAQQGYKVARRTVTKYRESMNIPIARLRKKLNI